MKKTLLLLLLLLCCGWSYQSLPMKECQWCHTTGSIINPLQRCHGFPQKAFPKLKNDPKYIRVLCHRCHMVLNHRNNTKTYNPDFLYIVDTFTNELPNVSNVPRE